MGPGPHFVRKREKKCCGMSSHLYLLEKVKRWNCKSKAQLSLLREIPDLDTGAGFKKAILTRIKTGLVFKVCNVVIFNEDRHSDFTPGLHCNRVMKKMDLFHGPGSPVYII